MKRTVTAEGITIEIGIQHLGEDFVVTVGGGERPHIGSTVLSIPRPSLMDPNKLSCTSSVLNCVGHKDEELCRAAAETVCRHFGKTTVCVGGVHLDEATPEQIRLIGELVFGLLAEMIEDIE